MGEEPESLPEARFKRYRNAIRVRADTLQELVERVADTVATYSGEALRGAVTLLLILIDYSGGAREARVWVAPEGVYGTSNVKGRELPERDFYTATIEIMDTTPELMRFDHEVLGYRGFRVERVGHGEERALVARLLGAGLEAQEQRVRAEEAPAPAAPGEEREARQAPPLLEFETAGPGTPVDVCLRVLSVYCSHGCSIEDPEAAILEDTPIILYGEGPSYVCIAPEKSEDCEYRVVYLGAGESWEKCMGRSEVSRLVRDLVARKGYEALRL